MQNHKIDCGDIQACHFIALEIREAFKVFLLLQDMSFTFLRQKKKSFLSLELEAGNLCAISH